MCINYNEASLVFCGVLEAQKSDSAKGGPVGVGVRSLISSCKMTFSGSNGTSPAPRKPPSNLQVPEGPRARSAEIRAPDWPRPTRQGARSAARDVEAGSATPGGGQSVRGRYGSEAYDEATDMHKVSNRSDVVGGAETAT